MSLLEPFIGPLPADRQQWALLDGVILFAVEVLNVRTPAQSPNNRLEWLGQWTGYPSDEDVCLPACNFDVAPLSISGIALVTRATDVYNPRT